MAIRIAASNGESFKTLASEYGVDNKVIYKIVRGVTFQEARGPIVLPKAKHDKEHWMDQHAEVLAIWRPHIIEAYKAIIHEYSSTTSPEVLLVNVCAHHPVERLRSVDDYVFRARELMPSIMFRSG